MNSAAISAAVDLMGFFVCQQEKNGRSCAKPCEVLELGSQSPASGQVLKPLGLSGPVMWPWEDHPPGPYSHSVPVNVCTVQHSPWQ